MEGECLVQGWRVGCSYWVVRERQGDIQHIDLMNECLFHDYCKSPDFLQCLDYGLCLVMTSMWTTDAHLALSNRAAQESKLRET